jgi:hypothetical protein
MAVAQHARARGHVHPEVLTVPPVAVPPLAGPADGRLVVDAGTKRREVGQLLVGNEDDVAAPAAIATVGTAPRRVRLAAERQAAVAPASGLDVDLDLVGE